MSINTTSGKRPAVLMNVRLLIMALSSLSALISLTGLWGCSPGKDPLPFADRVITSPRQDFDTVSLSFYDGGVRRWHLDADYMSRPLSEFDTGSILVVPVRISVYDTLGGLATRVLADSGLSNAKMDVFDLWGGVYMKNENDMVVKSERIKWFKAARRVTSEEFVQIETAKGDILRGRGLDAVDDFSRFSFSADVSGKFPDFKRRMEEGDDDFFK